MPPSCSSPLQRAFGLLLQCWRRCCCCCRPSWQHKPWRLCYVPAAATCSPPWTWGNYRLQDAAALPPLQQCSPSAAPQGRYSLSMNPPSPQGWHRTCCSKLAVTCSQSQLAARSRDACRPTSLPGRCMTVLMCRHSRPPVYVLRHSQREQLPRRASQAAAQQGRRHGRVGSQRGPSVATATRHIDCCSAGGDHNSMSLDLVALIAVVYGSMGAGRGC